MSDLVAQAERKVSFETLFQQSLDFLEETDDIKALIDMDNQAELLKQYALRASEDSNYARNFAEIRARTQRKMGIILKKSIKQGNPQMSRVSTFGKLEDFGISRDQSSNWQNIVALPDWAFEHYVKSDNIPSTSSAVKAAKIYLEFKDIVKDKPAKERTALLRKGILGNMATDDFIELAFPTPKKTEKKKPKKETTHEPETFSMTSEIQEFYENMESFKEYLDQIEEKVEEPSVTIIQADVDLYTKAVQGFKGSMIHLEKIGDKMKQKVLASVGLDCSDVQGSTEPGYGLDDIGNEDEEVFNENVSDEIITV